MTIEALVSYTQHQRELGVCPDHEVQGSHLRIIFRRGYLSMKYCPSNTEGAIYD